MNLKTLITTFVLGSSSLASADSVSFYGSAHVSLGGHSNRSLYAPVIVRNHRTVAEPCDTAPAPVYAPPPIVYQPSLPVYQPTPVWSGPYYNPQNTGIGRGGSTYHGWMGASSFQVRPTQWDSGYREVRSQNWFDLTEATRIDSGREFFNVGAGRGQFRALMLQNLGGRHSSIEQVTILFGRGSAQVVKLNRILDRNNPTITIDLDGDYRSIDGIVVYGSTEGGAAYKILAM